MEPFNINDFIKVKLTEYGRNIHYNYYKNPLGKLFKDSLYRPTVDEEGFTRYQLHEFMNIFGPHMILTADQIIEGNLIYFE